jgi:hypothetical protein
MKMHWLAGVAMVAAACVLSACGAKDMSRTIACELNGTVVSTPFTFNSFQSVLASEHGDLQVVTNVSLKSKSLQVYFRPLDDGRLLAERAVVVGALTRDMAPAVLFGLTNSLPAPAMEGAAVEVQATN